MRLMNYLEVLFNVESWNCINDIENEPMFQNLGVDFVEKAVYLLQKVRV
jgi:thiopurine S-methyltransferase